MSSATKGAGIRFNGTLKRFEDAHNPRVVFRGVHQIIERMLLPEGLTLEHLHELLGKQAPSRDRVDGIAFGSKVHDHVTHLVSSGKWAAKDVCTEWADAAHLRSLITLSKRLGLRAFKADLPVADRAPNRLFATALDALFQRSDKDDEAEDVRHVVAELKVFRTITFADLVCEEYPTLRPPFDALPLTLGFLAEVQAALSLHMFDTSYPRRAETSEAIVFIVDRQSAQAYWREVSKEAELTARCILKRWDSGDGKEAAKRVQEICKLAAQARREGESYEDIKARDGSGRLNLDSNIRARIVRCVSERVGPVLLKRLKSPELVDSIFAYI